MSDTPRTDAESFSTVYQGELVHADFARQLERELAEAREQRDTLAEACRKIDDILPSGTTNSILIEFRAALSAVKGGSHE